MQSTTWTRALAHASIPKHDNGDDSEDNNSDNTVFGNSLLEIKNDRLKNESIQIDVDSLTACYRGMQCQIILICGSALSGNKYRWGYWRFQALLFEQYVWQLFKEILNEQKIAAFGALEDVGPLIEECKRRLGTQQGAQFLSPVPQLHDLRCSQ